MASERSQVFDFGITDSGSWDSGGNGVTQTSDPDIVKITVPPGGSIPAWVTATATQADGSIIGYGPTNAAIARGYFVAAVDTVSALPAQVADTVANGVKALPDVAKYVLIGLALVAIIKLKS